MSEVFKKKFHQHLFPAHNWSSSMKEVYFGESSILDSVDRSPHVHPLLHCCCGNLCPALCAAAIKQLYFVERGGWRRPVGWKVNYRHSVDDENHWPLMHEVVSRQGSVGSFFREYCRTQLFLVYSAVFHPIL